jgi:hypothetical protein
LRQRSSFELWKWVVWFNFSGCKKERNQSPGKSEIEEGGTQSKVSDFGSEGCMFNQNVSTS